jgi:uncharacterized membrane protein YphA (DoxX/SURF4 family)
MLLIFGWPKLRGAWAFVHTGQWAFVDFNRRVGLPFPVFSAVVQTLNESVATVLVAGGLFSRVAAAALGFGFAVATACSLHAGEDASLLAAYFSLIFTTLCLTGPGEFALDQFLDKRARSRTE